MYTRDSLNDSHSQQLVGQGIGVLLVCSRAELAELGSS